MKNLGVVLDEKLNCKQHVIQLTLKNRIARGIIFHHRKCLKFPEPNL